MNTENKLENILNSAKEVADKSQYVTINKNKIKEFIQNTDIKESTYWLTNNPFGILDLDIEEIVNFLIIYEAIDYSFWGEPKWTIKTENGNLDGAFALMYALLKLQKTKGHLNFEEISKEEFSQALRGNTEIPLLKERYGNALEVSKTINKKMQGSFYQFIKGITDDVSLFNIIIENFPCFKDVRTYQDQPVFFYKLAQLATSDILHIRAFKENIKIDCSSLVGCADYKIPQILRALGILEYHKELAELIDHKKELAENSIYEVEIRANMIVAINLIKKECNHSVSSIAINDMIWSLGKEKSKEILPYHLTRTMSY